MAISFLLYYVDPASDHHGCKPSLSLHAPAARISAAPCGPIIVSKLASNDYLRLTGTMESTYSTEMQPIKASFFAKGSKDYVASRRHIIRLERSRREQIS